MSSQKLWDQLDNSSKCNTFGVLFISFLECLSSLKAGVLGSDVKLNVGRCDAVDITKKFLLWGGEALEQDAQRDCGCPVPGSVQGEVGWGFEQPDLAEGVPAYDWKIGTS